MSRTAYELPATSVKKRKSKKKIEEKGGQRKRRREQFDTAHSENLSEATSFLFLA